MTKILLSRLVVGAFFCATLPACDTLVESGPDWTDDLGEVPAAASTAMNHTPMVVTDDAVIVGTEEGVWRRPLDRSDDWEQLGLEDVRIFAVRRDPADENTLFAAGEPDDTDAAPFYRSDDGGETWTPATEWPLDPDDDTTETFFDLVFAPDDPDRLYANLSGQSVAVSTDGGDTWALANGETEVTSGDPCVLHILSAQPQILYQGCEEPVGTAWVGTYDIDPDDPLNLDVFTHVAGGDDLSLEDRRANSMVSGEARPDTLYVGLEGALIAIEGSDTDNILEVASDGSDDLPYAFIKGIWLDPDDDDHLIFGGGIDGVNTEFSLFETDDHGDTVEQIEQPRSLNDPSVEQIAPIEGDRLAVLISAGEGASRSLRVFVLDHNGDPFE